MATDNKLSVLVESQLPGFLAEEGPNFVAFIKAYYEFLEQTGQQGDALKSFQSNQDIDTTNLDGFYEYFRREILVNFPEDVLIDKRLLVKKIKEVYERKGSLNAHKLLFKLLYNEDISFLDPSENILRASDGRWEKTNSFRIGRPFVGDPDTLIGEDVVGRSSGATGTVTDIVTTFESGIEVKQLFLKDDVGIFEDGEIVSNLDNTISGKIVTEVGSLADVIFGDIAFLTGGSGHVLGDRVSFTSASGSGANGSVSATTDRATTFTLVSGGSGYTNSAIITITGGVGSGGSAEVTSISNTEVLFTYDDVIDDLKDTPIGFGPSYSANSGQVSANLASANASTPLVTALGTTNITVGTINSISVTSIGTYSTLPNVTVTEQFILDQQLPDGQGGFKGGNAIISPTRIPGSITEVVVDNFGSRYNSIDLITVNNTTRSGTTPATGDPVISGVFIDEGKYVDTKGFLSWDQRLQDSFYYQIFSYVIRSDQALKTYKKLVNDVVHPAGTKFFGQIDLESEVDFRTDFKVGTFSQIEDLLGSEEVENLPGTGEITIPSALTFGVHQLDMEIPIDLGIESSVVVPNTHVLVPVIAPQTITSTEVVSNVNVLFVIGVDTSIGPDTVVNVEVLDFEFDLPAINSTAIVSTDTKLFLPGTGTVSISNNNTIDTYLGQPIEDFLDQPIILQGSPFAVIGNNTIFTVELSPGVLIEIEDQVPGVTANTIGIVNTIFSNTALSLNNAYPGGNTDLAIFRYTT